MANVTELPTQNGAEMPIPAPKQAIARKKLGRPGRLPVAEARARAEIREPEFFKRVSLVPEEDWGTRAFMYVYVDEPVCVANTWGRYAYAIKSSKAMLDLEPIKERFGSCKGWLSLNTRKTGKDSTDQIDRYDFEILDPTCPPKIAKGAWANDPRNKRWEALLPPEPPAKPSATEAAGTLLDSIRVYKEIRDEVKDEMEPTAAPAVPTDHARNTLETMKLAKELFAQPTATAANPAQDPLTVATNLFTLMNSSKAENPVIDLYRMQLEAMREELKELRKEKPPQKDTITQLVEFVTSDKFDQVKKVFGLGLGEVVGRQARTTAYDVVRDIASSPFGANLGQGLGMLLSNLANNGAASHAQQPNPQPRQQPPIVMTGPAPNGTAQPAENTEQRINRIGQTITQPMLYEFFLKDEDGTTWAQRMFDMWPEDYIFCKGLGAENLVNRYRQFPPAWAVIQPKESAFIEFMQEFCAWDPNEDEAPAPGEDDGVRELEGN